MKLHYWENSCLRSYNFTLLGLHVQLTQASPKLVAGQKIILVSEPGSFSYAGVAPCINDRKMNPSENPCNTVLPGKAERGGV